MRERCSYGVRATELPFSRIVRAKREEKRERCVAFLHHARAQKKNQWESRINPDGPARTNGACWYVLILISPTGEVLYFPFTCRNCHVSLFFFLSRGVYVLLIGEFDAWQRRKFIRFTSNMKSCFFLSNGSYINCEFTLSFYIENSLVIITFLKISNSINSFVE